MKVSLIVGLLITMSYNCFSQGRICDMSDSSICYSSKTYISNKLNIEKKFECINYTRLDMIPMIADVDLDCIPEIICKAENLNEILFLNSLNGMVKYQIPTYRMVGIRTSIAISNIDSDPFPELFVVAQATRPNPSNIFEKLICYKVDGTIMWISDTKVHNNRINQAMHGVIGFADFNKDGAPEVYMDNQIFNGQNGILLSEGGQNGIGGENDVHASMRPLSIAAQLDEDTLDLELAAGYTIYKVQLTNKNGISGNKLMPYNIIVDGLMRDGNTSVADINLDGKLDVIVSSPGIGSDAKLYCYNLENGATNLIASVSPPGTISNMGAPCITFINTNKYPSILITRENLLLSYRYDQSNVLRLEWSLATTDNSGLTGITCFDLNNDNVTDIIYRDETHLKIINLINGIPVVTDSLPCKSGTWDESPILADIDNSGQAKICVPCSFTNDIFFGHFTIFGAPSNSKWAPARGIWNQVAYNPLQINDDLTIPQYQQNQAKYQNGRYNNFYQQESQLDSNGMYKVAAASLWGRMNCMNYNPIKDEFLLNFDLYNKKDASRSSGDRWYVTFYDGDPEQGGIAIDSVLLTKDLNPGDTLRDQIFTLKRYSIKQLFMVINTSRLGGGAFNDKDFKILECDYEDNISQWIEFPVVTEIKDVFCESKGYKYKDSTYRSTGKYYYIIRNTQGCDQEIAILDLEARDSFLHEVYYSSCDSISLIDTIFYNSGTKTFLYHTAFGCDSTIIAHVEIRNSNVKNISTTSCDSIIWNGSTLKQSGKYNYSSTNINACDSITTLDLTINNSKIIDQYKSACNFYIWNGNTYAQSGDYTHQSYSINGCDSTTILHLTIDTLVREFINITECNAYNWNGNIITATGIYMDTFRTVNGCDSIVTLDLNIANSRSSSSQVSCDQYTWNNKLLTHSGIYYDTLKNNLGCDSIVQLNLTINNSNTNTLVIHSCTSYNWKNKNISQSGIYHDTISSSLGCDSISILNLTIHLPFDTSIIVKSCESYTWNGQTITQSGQYQYKGLTQHNCDSTIQLILTINKNSSGNLNLSVCDSIEILGKTYNIAGSYQINTLNYNGCDSTINLTLSILSQKIIENRSSCDSFNWNNQIYTQSGTYFNKSTNINGCDSTHQLNLMIHPSFRNNINAQDCKEYFWSSNNTTYYQSGIYQTKYNTTNGCDSTLTLNLTIHPDFEKSDTITTNTTYQWPINQKSYNQSGTYQESYTDINGCDSIFKLLLIIIDDKIEIYAPNVLNPNSSINNSFTLYDNGTRAIINTLRIYDRWGGLLWQKHNFPTNNPAEGWDGTSNNVKLNPGVYIWHADVLTHKGRKMVLKGDVTIVQ